MISIWPQLVALAILITVFLVLFLRLRPSASLNTFPRKVGTGQKLVAQLEYSPAILIGCALIAVLIMVTVAHGVYSISRTMITSKPTSPVFEMEAQLAQLANELEEYRSNTNSYPLRLNDLENIGGYTLILSIDTHRSPLQQLDYRTDGSKWWLLRSVGPDSIDGISGKPFPMETYNGEGLDGILKHFLYDPSNGIKSAGDIILTNEKSASKTEH
jgi:hypothetical protein